MNLIIIGAEAVLISKPFPQCTEPMVDLGDVVVGSSVSRSLTIHNNSNCSLHYNLLVDQEIQGPYDDENTIRDVMGECSGYRNRS